MTKRRDRIEKLVAKGKSGEEIGRALGIDGGSARRLIRQVKTESGAKKTTVSHIMVPDCQIRPGVSTDFLTWISHYIADRKPDVLVQIGDFADMNSLSSYDVGKKAHEGKRYMADIATSNLAMERLMQYVPASTRKVLTLGNHEDRIDRAVESDAKLEGALSTKDLNYEKFGFEVYPFLQPVVIDGVAYCHYFPRSASGTVGQTKRGAPNARAQLIREGRSAVSGHQQGLDIACMPLGGVLQWGIIAGSAYPHFEKYLSPQGNTHWRGILVFHEVHEGYFDLMTVSLSYLKRRYGHLTSKRRKT